jgi:Fe-S-cluster containining protein
MRFACTQCGACCNRSPELALSETAALADVFVFRLMFRLYQWPRRPAGPAEAYYETKRLLTAFAARKYEARRGLDQVNYLMISALTLDTGGGACTALNDGRCSIYERRPLACRTVPFHYSRPEASAESDLAAFVETPGFGCNTGPGAPVVLAGGRIVDPQVRQTRREALALAERDRRWEAAISRRLKPGSATDGLPGLREIEANAAIGAMTTSMAVAWQIAAETGVMDDAAFRSLLAAQLGVIDRELASAACPLAARETLCEMRAEYRARLDDPGRLAAVA